MGHMMYSGVRMHTLREGKAYVHRESLGLPLCNGFANIFVFKPSDQRYRLVQNWCRKKDDL